MTDIIYFNYTGTEYDNEKFRAAVLNAESEITASESSCVYIPETADAMSFITRAIAGFNLCRLVSTEKYVEGCSDYTGDGNVIAGDIAVCSGSEKISGILVEKWLDFNRKALSAKKITSVYIEDSAEVLNSFLWLNAFAVGKEITVASEPCKADLAIVSLRSMLNGKIDPKNYSAILSTGIDAAEFSDLRSVCGDTIWINYYAAPYCFCVSFAKQETFDGTDGIYHQLKPITGSSICAADDKLKALPKNVIGRLMQTFGDAQCSSYIRCTVASDGRLIAGGFSDDVIYADGRYISAERIIDALLRSERVDSCCVSGNVVYYTQKYNYSEYEIAQAAESICVGLSDMLEFREVPFIPSDDDGYADISKLSDLTNEVYGELKSIRNALASEIDADSYAYVDYENKADSIVNADNAHDSSLISDDIKITDEIALIEAKPLDYSRFNCRDLSDIIAQAALSCQKLVYITPDGRSEQTYSELYEESLRIAARLLELGIKERDTVIFQIPDNHRYIAAFWGCILIGAIIAPLGVLDDYGGNNLNAEKLYNIFNLLDNAYVLAEDDIADDISVLLKTEKVIKYGSIVGGTEPLTDIYSWKDDETCLMLFTSGSTGLPKGVELSQKNVVARTLGEIEMYGLDSSISDFNWMTLTHAAGIIWSHIRDTYLKAFQVQADTNTILKNPLSLLDYMSEFKSTTMWTANFAFALLADSIDENVDYGWDLSHATNVYSGGETNVSKSLREFLRKTEKYGFPKNGLIPAFGMTETSSCMTYYNDFSLGNSSDQDRFIPIGMPANGHSVRITDENGNICKKGEIGKIEYIGDTITKGYYKNPEANEESFTDDGYFITGDLGYITGNDVVLTGRIKEMIIINGLNYYVQDIEAIVDEMDEVLTSYTAALSVKSSSGAEEILIVFTPVQESLSDEAIRELTAEIRDTLMKRSGLYAKYIVPDFKEKSMRTEIGKKQRSKYRKNFESGMYDDMLRRSGIIKEDPYVMEEVWSRRELRGIPSAISYSVADSEFSGKMSGNIVDMFAIEHSEDPSGDFVKALLERAKKWAESEPGTVILVPTVYGIVTGDDKHLNVNSALISGFIKSFNIEHTDKRCIHVDMDVFSIETAVDELCSPDTCEEAVYRGGKRFTAEYHTISHERASAVNGGILNGGTVLVAGGFGGVGMLLCDHLLRNYNVSLLIVGRSVADEEKLSTLRKSAVNGNTADYISCDVTNESSMNEKIAGYISETGRKITSVIDLVGVMKCADGSSFWSDIDSHRIENEAGDTFSTIVESKLLTTIALKNTAEKIGASEFIIFGSVNGIQGGSGLSAYAAGCGFQNQYAEYLIRTSDLDIRCINWSGWYDTGMSAEIPEYVINVSQSSGFRFANSDENLRYFDAAVQNGLKNIIVGLDRNNLKNRIVTNDKYSPAINVFYTGHDADTAEIVGKAASGSKIRYFKTDSITLNSDNKADVNLAELRRRAVTVRESVAEMTPFEKKLANVWSSVLHLSSVGPDDNFFEIGGNSLLLTKLAYETEAQLGISIPIQDIMFFGTIRKLAQHFASDNDEMVIKQLSEKMQLISNDLIPTFDIKEKLASASERRDSGSIVVIGTSTIQCIYVLAGLINRYSDRDIYFLYRASSQQEAETVINGKMKLYDFAEEAAFSGLHIVAADFTERYFGMSESEYLKLADETEIVYHFDINANLVTFYDVLRKVNIIGTNRVLEFCCEKRRKKLNYVSSLAVFNTISADRLPIGTEKDIWDVDDLKDLSGNDYLYSIYTADRLVQNAQKSGLDCTVIRPPRVMGDSRTGKMDTDDLIWIAFRYILMMDIIPVPEKDVEWSELFIPVDRYADTLIALSTLETGEQRKVFHIKGIPVTSSDIGKWVRSVSRTGVTEVPFSTLIAKMGDPVGSSDAGDGDAMIMRSIQGHLRASTKSTERTAEVNDEMTKELLKGIGFDVYEDPDAMKMFNITYDYLKRVRFFG